MELFSIRIQRTFQLVSTLLYANMPLCYRLRHVETAKNNTSSQMNNLNTCRMSLAYCNLQFRCSILVTDNILPLFLLINAMIVCTLSIFANRTQLDTNLLYFFFNCHNAGVEAKNGYAYFCPFSRSLASSFLLWQCLI